MHIVVYDCVTGDALTEKYGPTGPLVIEWIKSHLPEASFSAVHIAGNQTAPMPENVDGNVNAYLAHQDQVIDVPPDAEVIASAAHCPVAALSYDFPALSVQFHPEYNREFARDLIDMFGAELMSTEQLQAARDSLSTKAEDALWCTEVADFFRSSNKNR